MAVKGGEGGNGRKSGDADAVGDVFDAKEGNSDLEGLRNGGRIAAWGTPSCLPSEAAKTNAGAKRPMEERGRIRRRKGFVDDSQQGGQSPAEKSAQSKPGRDCPLGMLIYPVTPLGSQTADLPGAVLLNIEEAVVEAIEPALPELEMVRNQAITAPILGFRDLAFGVFGL